MNRYVLKINNLTYVKDIRWIIGEIPSITTDNLENAAIYREEYLNYIVISDGSKGGKGVSRKDLLLKYFPHLKIVKIKIVVDEGE